MWLQVSFMQGPLLSAKLSASSLSDVPDTKQPRLHLHCNLTLPPSTQHAMLHAQVSINQPRGWYHHGLSPPPLLRLQPPLSSPPFIVSSSLLSSASSLCVNSPRVSWKTENQRLPCELPAKYAVHPKCKKTNKSCIVQFFPASRQTKLADLDSAL